MNDPFRRQLLQRILGYRQLEHSLREALEDLRGQLDSVTGRLRSAEDLYRAEFGEAPGEQPTLLAEDDPLPETGALTGLSWADAMEAVLRGAGDELHVSELWDRMQRGGFQTTAADPLRSIVAIALRSPHRFERAGPGRYRLNGAGRRGARGRRSKMPET